MPIEFNCRFCGAMIRVPDKAKGGKGKCPKCGQRITVPKTSTIKLPDPTPAPELPFELPKPKPAKESAADPNEVLFQEFHDDAEPAVVEFGGQETEPTEPGEYSYGSDPDPTPASSSSRRKKKQKTDGAVLAVIGLIVVACLLIAGFLLAPLLTPKKITGELSGATAESLELPPASIAKSRIDFPADELATLLKKLEFAPAKISSTSTQITISANVDGLLFSVAPGSHYQFYRADPSSNENVRTYLREHQEDLNDIRQKEINRSLTTFVEDYRKALAKKSSDGINGYRDSLAIPSLVKGVGHQLEAQHGRIVSRCVYEDSDGGLYFLFPEGVTEFEIHGRENSNGQVVVPMEIHVKVAGKIELPKMPDKPNPPKADAKPKAKNEAKEAEDQDEKMGGTMNGNK